MEVMTFVVPCLFGLEGLAAEELRRLGLDSVRRKMAGSCFRAVREAMAMANCGYGPESGCFLRLAKAGPLPLRAVSNRGHHTSGRGHPP